MGGASVFTTRVLCLNLVKGKKCFYWYQTETRVRKNLLMWVFRVVEPLLGMVNMFIQLSNSMYNRKSWKTSWVQVIWQHSDYTCTIAVDIIVALNLLLWTLCVVRQVRRTKAHYSFRTAYVMGERGWFNCSVFLEVFLSVVWRSLNTAQFVRIKKGSASSIKRHPC